VVDSIAICNSKEDDLLVDALNLEGDSGEYIVDDA
jgi:hypothetical protein